MSTDDQYEYIFRIFWPEHLCRPLTESGYLVGWILPGGTVVVACKASFANAAQINGCLDAFHQQDISSLGSSFGHGSESSVSGTWTKKPMLSPVIVGYLSREGEGLCEPGPREESDLWIDVFTARTQIGIRDVLVHGMTVPGRVIVTLYDESIECPWHVYAAAPINLDLTAQDSLQTQSNLKDGETSLPHIIDYVNTASQLYTYVHSGDTSRFGEETEDLTQIGLFWCIWTWILEIMTQALLVVETSTLGERAKRFSAVGQQLDLVVRRNMYLVNQWRTGHCTRRAGREQARCNAQYAGFWNSVWVIGVDVVLGCVAGVWLILNAQSVVDATAHELRQQTVTSLEQTIVWLRGWPAGLKLNNGLDGFLAELFLWLIHFWTVVFQPQLTRHLSAVVATAGWAGLVGGCSMQLAVLSDTLALATLHTYWFYMVATRIFHWQLVTLYSLFNLFRGRKLNVLRCRIDSCDYDLGQLLIGTILFTLLTYLFPTVLVYYLTFASRRLAVIMVQGLLEILLGLLNHCPLFYLALRLRDPRFFPSGVWYDIAPSRAERFIEPGWHLPGSPVHLSRDPIPLSARSRMNVTVVYMRSTPMPLSAMLFQYYQLWIQFSASYLSQGILRSLIVGDVIHPVQRLQHTMIPGLTASSANL
ncbi:pig-Q [Coemansia sp. RSA 1365]|nr:pig-Q [Coemansia sp. RSA 1365]